MTRKSKGMRKWDAFCLREGPPKTVVIDGIYGRIVKNSTCSSVNDFDVIGKGLKNCRPIRLQTCEGI